MESVPEPENSSPVLTWILGYFWCLTRGVSLRLEWGHARALSFRAVAAVSLFPSRGSRNLWLSHEAFPRGFPTGLSHVPPWCQSILGLKVEAVQGKQVSLEWTETSGGLWVWWHDPGVPLTFLVERASSGDATGTTGIFPGQSGKGSLILSQDGELGLLWMWVVPWCFLWSGDGSLLEPLELQLGCEGPFGSSRG